MVIQADEVTKILKSRIEDFKPDAELAQVGEVLKVGDGVAVIYGLKNAMAGELLKFPNDVYGIAFNLETDSVGAVLMGDTTKGQGRGPGPFDRAHRRNPHGQGTFGPRGQSPGPAPGRQGPLERHKPPAVWKFRAPGRHRTPAGQTAHCIRASRPSIA